MSTNKDRNTTGKTKWLNKTNEAKNLRDIKFITTSSEPVELLGTPELLSDSDYDEDLGYPGEYPYTRGKLWSRHLQFVACHRCPSCSVPPQTPQYC